jgi:hypothetical protein
MTDDLIAWAIRHHVSFEAIAELRAMWGDAGGPSHVDDTLRGHVSEAAIQSHCILEAPRRGLHLFRNNVGALKSEDGRMIRFGLANDSKRRNEIIKSGDLIGIGPGGQFVSIECKRPGWTYSGQGREPAQLAWIQLVIAAGGRAKFVTDAGEL